MIIPGKTKGIFVAGTNPSESWTYSWPAFVAGLEAGTKMLCIDPRFSETARLSEKWLAIRPGTDAALFMAMINVLIEEDLYDHDFVEKWTFGFDKLKERAKQYTPEKAAEITWIPAEKIREAARFIAKNSPCTFPFAYAIESSGRNSLSNVRAKYMMPALTGNIDIEGGEYLHAKPKFLGGTMAMHDIAASADVDQMMKQVGLDKYRALNFTIAPLINQAADAKGYWTGGAHSSGTRGPNFPTFTDTMVSEKPYPIKAMISGEVGPMRNYPNIKKVYEGLKKLELFVYIECAQMTPEAMIADYVLPGTSQFERNSGYATVSCQGEIEFEIAGDRAVASKIPGLWDLRDDSIIYRDLAVATLGNEKVDKVWPWKTLEEFQDIFYEPAGWTRKQVIEEWKGVPPYEPKFKKYEEIDPETGQIRGFGTPEGKVAFYSTILEQLDYDPLPYYQECAWTPISAPDIAKDFPLIMCSGARFQEAHHGELRHISLMRHLRPFPRVKMHPLTARNMGIGDGEWVYIETPVGRCMQQVRYDFGVNPKVVSPEHGWWRPELPGEEPFLHGWTDWNIDVTIPNDAEQLSPELGAWCFKAALAKVYSANIGPMGP